MPLSDRLGCTATTLCIYSSAHMYTAHSTHTVTRDPRVGWGLRVPTTPTAMMPLSDRCTALTLYIHTGSSTHDVYTLASLTHTHTTHRDTGPHHDCGLGLGHCLPVPVATQPLKPRHALTDARRPPHCASTAQRIHTQYSHIPHTHTHTQHTHRDTGPQGGLGGWAPSAHNAHWQWLRRPYSHATQ